MFNPDCQLHWYIVKKKEVSQQPFTRDASMLYVQQHKVGAGLLSQIKLCFERKSWVSDPV